MTKKASFEEQEVRVRQYMVERAERAISLRNKDSEFHGLEREFLYHQSQMIVDYERTKDIKHPRDLGDARENLLQDFLRNSGYLPKKYTVSERSVRIISPTGHISNEIDIALYDAENLITLMKRQKVYEVYPIENTYGVIQVKSNLTKKELKKGLENLRSFKKLRTSNNASHGHGFAILFAYCSDMKWADIVNELKAFASSAPKSEYPNAIFILDRGFFLFMEEGNSTAVLNHQIEALKSVAIYGVPDRQQLNLFQFNSLLIDILIETKVTRAELRSYFRLPNITEEKSYRFMLGNYAEFSTCKIHGDFSRKISSSSLKTIVSWCRQTAPINSVKAINIAYNQLEDEKAYERQPQVAYIYNPDNLSLTDALTLEHQDNEHKKSVTVLAYDMIETEGMCIWLPYYYSVRDKLISDCPKCKKSADKQKTNSTPKKMIT